MSEQLEVCEFSYDYDANGKDRKSHCLTNAVIIAKSAVTSGTYNGENISDLIEAVYNKLKELSADIDNQT